MTPRARLTPEQDRRYGQLFAIAADEHKYDFDDATTATGEEASARADAEAWAGLIEEWPGLAAFDGAEPEEPDAPATLSS